MPKTGRPKDIPTTTMRVPKALVPEITELIRKARARLKDGLPVVPDGRPVMIDFEGQTYKPVDLGVVVTELSGVRCAQCLRPVPDGKYRGRQHAASCSKFDKSRA
jgi:hypothetical protein